MRGSPQGPAPCSVTRWAPTRRARALPLSFEAAEGGGRVGGHGAPSSRPAHGRGVALSAAHGGGAWWRWWRWRVRTWMPSLEAAAGFVGDQLGWNGAVTGLGVAAARRTRGGAGCPPTRRSRPTYCPVGVRASMCEVAEPRAGRAARQGREAIDDGGRRGGPGLGGFFRNGLFAARAGAEGAW